MRWLFGLGLLPLWFLLVGAAQGQDSVTLPLQEYQQLYRQSLERVEGREDEAALIGIERADYSLRVREARVSGRIALSGVLIRGRPEPLRLFSNALVVTSVVAAQGGHVMGDEQGYLFVSDGSSRFSVSLEVAASLDEDALSQRLALDIPLAVENVLTLNLTKGMRVLEAPGPISDDGRYHFSARRQLGLRVLPAGSNAKARPVVVDTFTRIEPMSQGLSFTYFCAPRRGLLAPLTVSLPSGARFLGSSLGEGQLSRLEGGRLRIDLGAGVKKGFTLNYVLDAPAQSASQRFPLAHIEDNRGREGEFALESAVDSDFKIEAKDLQQGIGAERLPEALRMMSEFDAPYARLPAGETLQLTRLPLIPVALPERVLDSLRYTAQFDESGSLMSTLTVDVPEGFGERLHIKALEGGEIWSLTVNDRPGRLLEGHDGEWVVPVDANRSSRVRLAFLVRGERLGLYGRLNTTVPETGLSAQVLQVEIVLPSRVELVSLDGGVVPDNELVPDGAFVSGDGVVPGAASGDGLAIDAPAADALVSAQRRYAFKRAFYKGQALDLAIYYKEPTDFNAGDLR